MKYYTIYPVVAGNITEKSECTDWTVWPQPVTKLHYEFDVWLGGDVVVKDQSCYLVTAEVASEIQAAGFSGVEIGDVEVSRSDAFMELYPARELPEFRWLKVHGVPCSDDVAMVRERGLVVSNRVLTLLLERGLANAEVDDYTDCPEIREGLRSSR